MLSVVDEEAKIRAYLPVLDQMVREGLVVVSDVEVIKYTHRMTPESKAGEPAS
jgi:PII-like signaling protein